jgi:hypothetical protein
MMQSGWTRNSDAVSSDGGRAVATAHELPRWSANRLTRFADLPANVSDHFVGGFRGRCCTFGAVPDRRNLPVSAHDPRLTLCCLILGTIARGLLDSVCASRKPIIASSVTLFGFRLWSRPCRTRQGAPEEICCSHCVYDCRRRRRRYDHGGCDYLGLLLDRPQFHIRYRNDDFTAGKYTQGSRSRGPPSIHRLGRTRTNTSSMCRKALSGRAGVEPIRRSNGLTAVGGSRRNQPMAIDPKSKAMGLRSIRTALPSRRYDKSESVPNRVRHSGLTRLHTLGGACRCF